MASFIWGRDPQEAMDNPYEYEAQNQFIREAENVLIKFGDELSKYDRKFTQEQRTNKKAIWVLQNDALDSLKDILYLLKVKKHRPAGKLFRDVLETLDLASYFYSKTKESKEKLISWYDDNIIPNRVFRQHIKKTKGEDLEKVKSKYYSIISKFNHRTYKILLYSYILGRNNLLIYDGYRDTNSLVLPSTLAMYLAILADFIKLFSEELTDKKLVPKSRINDIWESSYEKKSIKRKYLPAKSVLEKYFPKG
jgi:hypothetical protein